MEDLTYTPIGSVLHLNKAGELAQKRMNAAKLCDGLYITEPDKTQFVSTAVRNSVLTNIGLLMYFCG